MTDSRICALEYIILVHQNISNIDFPFLKNIAEIDWEDYWLFTYPIYKLPKITIFMYIYEVVCRKRIRKLMNSSKNA